MIRLNQRLALTKNTDPVKIEFDLMKLVPQKEWTRYSHLIILHGRSRCFARKPDCPHCEIFSLCPYQDKTPPVTVTEKQKKEQKAKIAFARSRRS